MNALAIRRALALICFAGANLVLMGCADDASAPLVGSGRLETAAAVVHSATGSGLVEHDVGPVIPFRTSVAAHEDASGRDFGTSQTQADLSEVGLGFLVVGGSVDCLFVEGNSAWVGATVQHTNQPDLIPPGIVTITLIRDLGGNGQDIMHTEFFAPGTSCETKPPVPETVVASGNFKVR